LKQNSNRGIKWTVRAKKPGGEFPAQNLAKFGGSVIDLSVDLKYQLTFKYYSTASFLLTWKMCTTRPKRPKGNVSNDKMEI